MSDKITACDVAAASGPSDKAQAPIVPVELLGVEGELKNGNGFWRPCSGCHETEDGHPVGHYPFSAILNCDLGSGCGECGGIGAVWDDTDYDAMAAAGDADEIAREQAEEARPVDQRALVQSMDEIEALSNTEDRGITVMEAESIMLVLLELRRLRAGGSPAPWTWLRRAVRRIPTREELLGGQRTRYVQLDEVIGWINEGEKMGDTLCNAPTPTVAADAAAPGVVAAAEALIAADRAQALTTEHVNALENAIAIQRGELKVPAAQPDERAAVPQAALTDEQMEALRVAANVMIERYAAPLRALLATAPTERMSDAARDVLAEHARQISVEGFTPEHDDKYTNGELPRAAACYAHAAGSWMEIRRSMPAEWPWARDWWKPGTPRRMLEKAAAMIISEMERIDRAAREAEIERSGSAGGEA
ncbi:hypothetical protein [Paraburkholderia tropica]|uniref:hypothetical protein n=1 Tax=Paraburkholderia tropica TaxID=92647 RepID=UPI003D2AE287